MNDEIEPHDDHKQFMNEGPVVGLKPRPAASISDIDGAKFLQIVILQPQDTVKEMVRLGVTPLMNLVQLLESYRARR